MLVDWSDADLNINLFLPQADVARDAPLVAVFTAAWVSRGREGE